MTEFGRLLRENRNYRYMWTGQVVSEVGDHFNNIALFSLALASTGSGLAVSGVLIARAIPAVLVGPFAGVVLDRWDRRRVMIASDLVRAVIALLFVLEVWYHQTWLLYLLSAALMTASPFFSAGRAAILPTIADRRELHAANSLTQTTQWTTTAVGAFLGGYSVHAFGYEWAFFLNSLSFLVSAWCISRLHVMGGFRASRHDHTEVHPWRDYRDGLRYLYSRPLLFAIALVGVGWASGGGASQILFSLFGELVFKRGPAGIGELWGCAGLGLVCGGFFAHWLAKRLSFRAYRWAIAICYIVHGGTYVLFSQMNSFTWALVAIGVSRAAVAVSSVLNMGQLLQHVADEYRGRVFATCETLIWSTMMFSLAAAGVASESVSPRVIGFWAGLLSSTTALFWVWAGLTGRLPEMPRIAHTTEEEEQPVDAVR